MLYNVGNAKGCNKETQAYRVMKETSHSHNDQRTVGLPTTTVMDTTTPARIQTLKKRKQKQWRKTSRHGMPTLPVYPSHIITAVILIFCGSVIADNYTGAGVPPVIHTGPPPHRPYNDQEPIKLDCNAEGTPPLSFKWLKNGKELDNQTSRTLKITSANSSDQAYYQCQASNLNGTAMSNYTFLERIFLARAGSGSNASHKMLVGKPFVATCDRMKGYKVTYEWRKIEATGKNACEKQRRGTKVMETSRISIYEENGSLAFSNLVEEDSGMYKCFAKGGGLSFGAGCFELTLSNAYNNMHLVPKFMHHSRSPLVVFKGEDFHLQCFFSGNPTPNVTWTKYQGEMPKRFSIDKNVGHRMTIKGAEPKDSGYYECLGQNDAGKSDPVRIQVRVVSRPRLTVYPVSQNSSLDNRVDFTCKGEGMPTPKATWYRNTEEIKGNTSHMWISNDETLLTLEHVTVNDTATYHCNLSNPYGYQLKGAYLIVSHDFITNVIGDTRPNLQEPHKNDGSGTSEEQPNSAWAFVLGFILALTVIVVIVVFLVIRKRRNSLSYQLGSVEPPDPRVNNGGEHAVGDRLLGQESGGSAVSV